MNSNKNIIFAIIYTLFIMVMIESCSEEILVDNSTAQFETEQSIEDENVPIRNEYFIDMKETEELATWFMSWNSCEKEDIQSRRKEDFVVVSSSAIKSDETNDTVMYVFNYNKGFTVVSATKATFPIMAYSYEDAFDESLDNGQSVWLEQEKESVSSIMQDSIVDEDVIKTYASYKETIKQNESSDSWKCFSEIRNYKKVGPLLTTEWHQKEPYNQRTPGKVSGCVPVAIAQVVNYYKTLNGENIDWNAISQGDNSAISDLIYNVGSYLDMDYSSTGSHPKFKISDPYGYDRIKNYFNQKGYSVSYTDCNAYITTCPALFFGYKKKFLVWPYNGHTWVMDGYEKYDVYKGCGEVAIRSSKQPTLSSYGVLFYHFIWVGVELMTVGMGLPYHIISMTV